MTEKANELPFPEGGDRKSTGRAELARDEAMERVERSHEDWIAWNRTPILAAARALGEFTTDDLWEHGRASFRPREG